MQPLFLLRAIKVMRRETGDELFMFLTAARDNRVAGRVSLTNSQLQCHSDGLFIL